VRRDFGSRQQQERPRQRSRSEVTVPHCIPRPGGTGIARRRLRGLLHVFRKLRKASELLRQALRATSPMWLLICFVNWPLLIEISLRNIVHTQGIEG
jgi:hypothetical protein